MILKGGQKRLVRVIWKGDKNLKEENAYRLIAESLPIKTETAINGSDDNNNVKIGINLGVRYVSSLYVAPLESKPNIKITRSVVEIENDQLMLVIDFENQGTRHELLNSRNLEVTTGNTVVKITKEEMEKALPGRYNLLAHHKLTVRLPLQATFPQGAPINVRILDD